MKRLALVCLILMMGCNTYAEDAAVDISKTIAESNDLVGKLWYKSGYQRGVNAVGDCLAKSGHITHDDALFCFKLAWAQTEQSVKEYSDKFSIMSEKYKEAQK